MESIESHPPFIRQEPNLFLLFAVSTPQKTTIVRIGREMERIGAENADRWKRTGRWKKPRMNGRQLVH
jgi:hypothetical protein